MGLPSKEKLPREAREPQQELVGFSTPREGFAGLVGQIAVPEPMTAPGMYWGQKSPHAQGAAPHQHAAHGKAAAANTKVSRVLGM